MWGYYLGALLKIACTADNLQRQASFKSIGEANAAQAADAIRRYAGLGQRPETIKEENYAVSHVFEEVKFERLQEPRLGEKEKDAELQITGFKKKSIGRRVTNYCSANIFGILTMLLLVALVCGFGVFAVYFVMSENKHDAPKCIFENLTGQLTNTNANLV
ncbi:hypothetical protein ENBRE01_1420 [Enteropsectra breve]|nr:hypothetical protein ENBRE01_1420 [Enteropsectra breve]